MGNSDIVGYQLTVIDIIVWPIVIVHGAVDGQMLPPLFKCPFACLAGFHGPELREFSTASPSAYCLVPAHGCLARTSQAEH